MRCRIEAEGPDDAIVDIRMKPADAESSVVAAAEGARGRQVLARGP